MRSRLLASAAMIALAGAAHAQAPTASNMTFNEDFNAPLNASPNGGPGQWATTVFGGMRTLPANGEQQYYTDNNFSTANGALTITATPGSNPMGLPYTSGQISSEKMFSQTYGYFEMKAQLPAGQGMWPAFWLMPVGGGAGEIDVMEAFGAPNGGQGGATNYSVALHDDTGGGQEWVGTGGANLLTGMHTFGLDWQPDTVTWYLDGQKVKSMPTPPDMHRPYYMIANVAVGGPWAGNATGETGQMKIDYIRAYSSNPSSPTVTPLAGGASLSSVGSSGPVTLGQAATPQGTSSKAAAGQPVAPSAAPQPMPTHEQVCTSIPAVDTLLPCGPLSTRGADIVDQQGRTVRIAGVGWIMTDGRDPKAEGAKIALMGFNTVRLHWVNARMPGEIDRLSQIVDGLAASGLKVIIANVTNEPGHGPQDNWGAQQKNGLWYDLGGATDNTDGGGNQGTVTDARFLQDWVAMAKRFAGNDAVIGYDLRNEPLSYPGMSTWGDGDPNHDIRLMYQRVGNAILAVDPTKLIIGEPPDGSKVGTNLPILSVPNKFVISVHDYPKYIDGSLPDGPAAVPEWNRYWGYLVRQEIVPVWIGEMGASFDGSAGGEDPAQSQAWADALVAYCNGEYAAQGGPIKLVHTSWWQHGYWPPGSSDVNGTLESDWLTAKPKQAAVYTKLRQKGIGGSPAGAGFAAVQPYGAAIGAAATNIGSPAYLAAFQPQQPASAPQPAQTAPAVPAQVPAAWQQGEADAAQRDVEIDSATAQLDNLRQSLPGNVSGTAALRAVGNDFKP